ncbi:MAG: hypothetical protein RLZZ579_700 [Actinomycetota bacterium]
MITRKHDDGLERCRWAWPDQIYIDYHDSEWGVPLRGQNELFERIALEGFQAGLSWITILKRREGFRKAFKNFEVQKVAKFKESDVERLMQDTGIIRNQQKIRAAIHNANLILDKDLDLTELLWSFAPKQPLTPAKNFEWLATSNESDAMSKELRKLGFKFVGSTTMYALMQSVGMVQDHAPGCFRRPRK